MDWLPKLFIGNSSLLSPSGLRGLYTSLHKFAQAREPDQTLVRVWMTMKRFHKWCKAKKMHSTQAFRQRTPAHSHSHHIIVFVKRFKLGGVAPSTVRLA